MTDDRTTELREKLTERGVEWVAYEKELRLTLKDFYDTRWNAHGVRWSYLEINGVATLSPVGKVEIELTPEQAIAATLGSERHAYEQRITGDGSDWGEIMRDAYDELMAAASESCTPDELADLEAHILGR